MTAPLLLKNQPQNITWLTTVRPDLIRSPPFLTLSTVSMDTTYWRVILSPMGWIQDSPDRYLLQISPLSRRLQTAGNLSYWIDTCLVPCLGFKAHCAKLHVPRIWSFFYSNVIKHLQVIAVALIAILLKFHPIFASNYNGSSLASMSWVEVPNTKWFCHNEGFLQWCGSYSLHMYGKTNPLNYYHKSSV